MKNLFNGIQKKMYDGIGMKCDFFFSLKKKCYCLFVCLGCVIVM